MATEDSAANQAADAPPPRARPVQGELPLMAPPATEDDILVPARMVNEWV
jgi:hypothetical protein